MNERIKELIEQTGYTEGYYESDDGPFIEPEFNKEKFAELMIRECMAVSEDVANADGNGPWFEGYISGVEELNRRIKQHFGVEE